MKSTILIILIQFVLLLLWIVFVYFVLP